MNFAKELLMLPTLDMEKFIFSILFLIILALLIKWSVILKWILLKGLLCQVF